MTINDMNKTKASRQSFWNLISKEKYTIVIPRIQRDYAQGREEAETNQIRQAFLKDIFDALIIGRNMDVNFIYGNIEVEEDGDKIFVPIDGQQRLTTLFLLHWYFASWSGDLQDSTVEMLNRFQYDTRFVAGSFCRRLVEDVRIDLKELIKTDRKLVDVIKDYYWFFSSYERDATIKAMLVMLQSIHDAVRKLENKNIVDTFFLTLTGEECPISFLFLDIADVGLTDEIYIKMNARGKALTRFENFKAQLSGYLSNKDEEFSKEFIGNINGRWAGFFWHSEYRPDVIAPELRGQVKKANVFDDQMMNLFRFIMTNEYMTRTDFTDDSSELKYLARRVLGDLNKESDFEFVGHLFFDEFKTISNHHTDNANVDIDTFRSLNVLLNVLTKRKEETGSIRFLNDDLFSKKYFDEENCFMRLIKSVQEKPLNYEEQLLLYAEYMFLIRYAKPDYSFDMTDELTSWLRFIYNISSNMLYNAVDDYLRSVRRIRKIIDDEFAADILEYAAKILHKNYMANTGYGFVELAMKEECIKAHLILKSEDWRKLIIDAENSFLGSQLSALLAFSGIWEIYEKQMSEYEVNNPAMEELSSIYDIMSEPVEDISYINKCRIYLKKFNMIFDKSDLKPEMENESILRRALLTFGGADSYMLPAGKPVRCFLDVNDRDNSFRRLFRDDNKKNKSDTVGVRIYFKQLLDSIDDTRDIVPQLQKLIDEMVYDEENKWKRYFIEMPEILDSLYKNNPDVTDDTAVFKNAKRYICSHSSNQVLLLEKVKTSSNNREYYSYVLYRKVAKTGFAIEYHKDFSEDSAKFAVYINEDGKTVKVSYENVEEVNQYMFVAKSEENILFTTQSMEEMIVFILGNDTTNNDDKKSNTEIEQNITADESEIIECKEENTLLVEESFVSGQDKECSDSDNPYATYMNWAIIDVFGDNKYNRFIRYCNDSGKHIIGDLIDFDFNALVDVPGIGRNKIDDIVERYNSFINGEFADDIEDNATEVHFGQINEELLGCDIDFLTGIGLKNKSLKRLQVAGFSRVGDLQNKTLSIFKQYMTGGDFDRILEIEQILTKPLIEVVEYMLKEYSDETDYKVTKLREDGYTLQTIGDLYNVTRERIRQMINRFEEKLSPILLVLQKRIQGERNYFFCEEIVNIFDNDDYNKVLLHWFKDCEGFEYLEFAGAFIELDGIKHHEQDILDIAVEFIGDGIFVNEHLEELDELMREKGYPFIDNAALINLVQEYGYHVYRDFVVKGRQSYGFLCAKVVEKYFPNGIKLYEGSEDLEKLRELAWREYGDIGISEDDRAFSTRLMDYLVLCDKGAGTAESNIKIDMQVLQRIKNYIDESQEREIYYSVLFAVFEAELKENSNVNNYNFLHGVLKLYFCDDYDFNDRDYLTKRGEGLASGKFDIKVREYIELKKRPISKNEVKKLRPGITDIVLQNVITMDERLMQWGFGTFYSMDFLSITDEDSVTLKKMIVDLLEKYNGYCSDSMLYDLTYEKYTSFIEKNNIEEASNLYYICMKLFQSEFDFRKPHITRKGLIESISVKNVALHLMNYPDMLLFSEFQKIASMLKWSPVTTGMVFADIEQDYMRVNEDLYIKKSNISLSQDTIDEIETILRKCMYENYFPLNSINNFDCFPIIEFEWNVYILRSIVNEYLNNQFKVIEPRSKDRRFERGIIVDSKDAAVDYADVVIYAIKQAGKRSMVENELLSLLIKKGLTYKMILKELYVTDKLNYSDGYFQISDN